MVGAMEYRKVGGWNIVKLQARGLCTACATFTRISSVDFALNRASNVQ
jgi:hypothetical protein